MAGLLENKVVACKALTRDGGAPFLLLRFQALQYRGLCAIGGQKLGMPRQIVCPMSRQGAPSFGTKGATQMLDNGGLSVAIAPRKLGWPHGDQVWKVAGSHIGRGLERACGSFRGPPFAARRAPLPQRCFMTCGRLATAGKMDQGATPHRLSDARGWHGGSDAGIAVMAGWQASCMVEVVRILASCL